MAQEKERPAGSQSLFRGLMLIEILSNYPNGCPVGASFGAGWFK
ncbi:DNA-binding transcriptional repressor [Escherichia coli]|uniref:DNA-binding transcriptional repressor n=1 Tax=Escherichia coli TaxID=562 RepID=A0A377DC75_ECOLX|nr:DNA-binding transcriptional repressor [Escherichia coli]